MSARSSAFGRGLRLAFTLVLCGLAGCGPTEPETRGSPPQLRLLTEAQYRNVIADVFGSGITFVGNFDPLRRTGGLLTVGARSAEVTPAASEEYVRMALQISAQVVNEDNRNVLIPCKPATISGTDDACTTRFVTQVGRLLFRRALTPAEEKELVDTAHTATQTLGDFYQGINASLVSMLVSPSFLFVTDLTETEANGGLRLTGYSRAARLSFLLWNSAPDETLLAAAGNGELYTQSGITKQVDRMLASPRLRTGVRAFFSDMLTLDDWDHTEKDSTIFPLFNVTVANDAREQTLRTIVDFLVEKGGDYRDLFTTRQTFMTGSLAKLYQVPVSRPDGGWTPYEFPAGDQRAGIVTQIGFASLYSHPERSSPTIRGRAIREVFLCQKVPDPPGNIDFSLFNDPNSPHKTQRQRLAGHASAPSCAGCHKLTDPVGLALEKIDSAGQLRTTENGEKIDTSGSLDGVHYDGALGLGKALHDNAALPKCLVTRMFSYATAHLPRAADRALLQYYQEKFAEGGYRFPDLLRRIATSPAFFAVSAPPRHRNQTASETPTEKRS